MHEHALVYASVRELQTEERFERLLWVWKPRSYFLFLLTSRRLVFYFSSLALAVPKGKGAWRRNEKKNKTHKWTLENMAYSKCMSLQYQSLSDRSLNASSYRSVVSNPALDTYRKDVLKSSKTFWKDMYALLKASCCFSHKHCLPITNNIAIQIWPSEWCMTFFMLWSQNTHFTYNFCPLQKLGYTITRGLTAVALSLVMRWNTQSYHLVF